MKETSLSKRRIERRQETINTKHIIVALIFGLFAGAGHGEVPQLINYQGRVTAHTHLSDLDGNGLPALNKCHCL